MYVSDPDYVKSKYNLVALLCLLTTVRTFTHKAGVHEKNQRSLHKADSQPPLDAEKLALGSSVPRDPHPIAPSSPLPGESLPPFLPPNSDRLRATYSPFFTRAPATVNVPLNCAYAHSMVSAPTAGQAAEVRYHNLDGSVLYRYYPI
ncbi:MAG: hypothetical protein CYPHOPRED_005243 [Cyphobasidiales sp. Tagirdzhanova-0007]|nr:MAG: hypothetical protein CYPHOPRED_005243 [Cyphobasidiales sp. Tagirdzhanova-0007]